MSQLAHILGGSVYWAKAISLSKLMGSIAELVRDAIRQVVLKPQATGPVAIWDGEPKRASMEHDSVQDEP